MTPIDPFLFDQQWMLALNFDGGSFLDTVMYAVSGKLIWIPLYLAIVGFVWKRTGWQAALLFLVTAGLMIACADQTASLAKQYLPQLRPSRYPPLEEAIHTVNGYRGGAYGTISSHAANCFALALLSSLVIRVRWYIWAIFIWAAVIAYSRIYLGVHYPTNIIWGIVEGFFWAWIWYRFFYLRGYYGWPLRRFRGMPTDQK